MAGPKDLQEFARRVTAGLKRSNDFLRGRAEYFDVSDNSVVGLRFLADRGDLRARHWSTPISGSMRARTDLTEREGGGTAHRPIGTAVTAEMRVLLGVRPARHLRPARR